MKKIVAVTLFNLMLFASVPVFAQQNTAPDPSGGWFCPGGRGAGRMANYSPGQCPRGFGPMGQRAAASGPVDKNQAAQLLSNYVTRTGNANLKAGEVLEKGDVFEVTVVTKDGSLVERLEIDKKTGMFRRI